MKHSKQTNPGGWRGWRVAAAMSAACALSVQAALITSVVETGGDNEATDTIVAQWTGQTFVNGIAGEPIAGSADTDSYTVGVFQHMAPAFVDRSHAYSDDLGNSLPIPGYLLDGEYIMSGNDNRDNDTYMLDVTVSEDVICYMLIDNRTSASDNNSPPNIGPGTGNMEWIDGTWTPVIDAGNRRGDTSQPDEVGCDESADGSINQWYSVYSKVFPKGTFQLYQANNAGQNMYGVVIKAVPSAPQMGPVTGNAIAFSAYLLDLGGRTLDVNSIAVQLDGAAVTVTKSKTGARTDIKYNLFTAQGQFFASGSTHDVAVSVNDTQGTNYQFEGSFTVADYATVPSDWKLASASDAGMNIGVYQTDSAPTPAQNTLPTTEQWWARGLPGGGQPAWDNVYSDWYSEFSSGIQVVNMVADVVTYLGDIDATPADGPDGFNSARPAANPQPNSYVPGIPGYNTSVENYVMEVTTYLQLNRGLVRMGVNSDDGFRVSVAPGQPGVRGLTLGLYNGGRGASDSVFDFVVEENGYYAFRLLYWQGTGGASCEWFTVNPDTGEKILVNGPGASVKAYKTASDRAVLAKMLPADGFTGTDPDATLTFQIVNGSTSFQAGSAKLMIDDVEVTPTVATVSGTTTISYKPQLQFEFLSAHTGQLMWTETTATPTEWTEDFTFTIRDVDGTKDPAALLSVPSGEMPSDAVRLVWTIGKYVTQLNPASLQILIDGSDVTSEAVVTEDAGSQYVTVDYSGTPYPPGDHSWSFHWADTGTKTETVTGSISVLNRGSLIVNVVETGGDNEPTDTIVAQWSGQTFVSGVANEPILNTAVDAAYTVPLFADTVPAYVDRAHRYLNDDANSLPIPSYLIGGEYIMSGNDNRDNDTYVLDVTVSQDVSVFMLIDNRTGGANSGATPPEIGPGTGAMEWIDPANGWEPVIFAGNRRGDDTQPDELGFDEGADGSINQWCSIYQKNFPAGTFQLYQANNPGRNMYGVVITEPWSPPTSLILNVVETGGDNEPTDTIVAQWTGQTFVSGVANEPLLNTAADAPYTVGFFESAAPAFVDRAHRYLDDPANQLPIPAYLVGGEYIMSGNDNRDNDAYVLDVTVSRPVDVYMLIDNRTGGVNSASTPPEIGPGTGAMEWIDPAQGWEPVMSAGNRRHDHTQPDELGFDEGADDTINQWYSVYRKQVPAGTFQLYQANNGGRNMYGVVITQPQVLLSPLDIAVEGDNVVITWQGGGTLQQADVVNGPYTDVAGAASPYSAPSASAAQFYQVKQ